MTNFAVWTFVQLKRTILEEIVENHSKSLPCPLQEPTKCRLIKTGHPSGLLPECFIQPVFLFHYIKAGLFQELHLQENLLMQNWWKSQIFFTWPHQLYRGSVQLWKVTTVETVLLKIIFKIIYFCCTEFCTEWPKELNSDEKIEKHFPIQIISSDYLHSSPTIRDAKARIVTLQVCE